MRFSSVETASGREGEKSTWKSIFLDWARGRLLTRLGARFQARLDRRVFDAVLRHSVMDHEIDEKTGREIVELLWELNAAENVTLVLVTHDESLAARAHHWVALHEGRAEKRV